MELTPEKKYTSASTAKLKARLAAISCQLPSDPINKCWLILGVQLKIHQDHLKQKQKTKQKPLVTFSKNLLNKVKSSAG